MRLSWGAPAPGVAAVCPVVGFGIRIYTLIRSLPVRFVDQTENWGFENKRREAKDAEKRGENPFLIALRSPRLCVSPGLSTNACRYFSGRRLAGTILINHE